MSTYAASGYQPRKPRAVSLGAAFLVNGVIIAGLVYSAPNVIREVTRTFPIRNYEDPLPPPPLDEPKPQPKAEHRPTAQPLPTVPDTVVKTKSETSIESTNVITDQPPPPTKLVETGPVTQPEPRVDPAPPLIGAVRDPRGEFQPEYPASELRLQRDGKVTLKVLVGANGRVKAVEQLSATSQAFFDATKRQALSKWRFKPATRGGVAEESWLTLTVTFRIQDQ